MQHGIFDVVHGVRWRRVVEVTKIHIHINTARRRRRRRVLPSTPKLVNSALPYKADHACASGACVDAFWHDSRFDWLYCQGNLTTLRYTIYFNWAAAVAVAAWAKHFRERNYNTLYMTIICTHVFILCSEWVPSLLARLVPFGNFFLWHFAWQN